MEQITSHNSNFYQTNTNNSIITNQALPKHLQITRGFSKVKENEEILNETRHQIESSNSYKTNEYSFFLPDLNKYEDYKFKEYLQNDLIELPTQCALTESGHLNWWIQGDWEGVCRPLYPMCTSGDGNCLLHAASLSMWGLHDRHLILRKALHTTLQNVKEGNQSPLWRRWKWEQMFQNRKYGLIYSEEEWSKEWNSLLKLSSYKPRVSIDSISNNESISNQDGQVYFESLEEFHVFLLAHILQRPIIIVSDTMLHDSDGEPLSPIPFGGIYLPFECDLTKCHRYPLVLAYDSAHFSALVLMNDIDDSNLGSASLSLNEINRILQSRTPYAIIPVTYSNNELLPIHFSYDPGENYDWSKFSNETQYELDRDQQMFQLQKYLDLCKIDLTEPGPSEKLRSNYLCNTSGLKINICNLRVKEMNNMKKSKPNKIQKFFSNIFKKSNESNDDDLDHMNQLKLSPNSPLRKSFKSSGANFFKTIKTSNKLGSSTQQNTSSQPKVLSYVRTDTNSRSFDDYNSNYNKPNENFSNHFNNQTFHRLKEFNTWNDLFYLIQNQKCLLCVKLNLAKPPKYDKMISNYIDSVKLRFKQDFNDKIQKNKQLQQQQPQQHQQQQNLKSSSSHTTQSLTNQTQTQIPIQYVNTNCVIQNKSCTNLNLCSNCVESASKANTAIRSIQLNTINNNHYSYNQLNSNNNNNYNNNNNNNNNNKRLSGNEYEIEVEYDDNNNYQYMSSYK